MMAVQKGTHLLVFIFFLLCILFYSYQYRSC